MTFFGGAGGKPDFFGKMMKMVLRFMV